MHRFSNLLIALLLVTYPIAIFFGLQHFDARTLGLILIAIATLRLLISFASTRGRFKMTDQLPSFALAAVGAISLLLNSTVALRLYPVLVNVLMLALFGLSLLWPPSAIERLARLQEPNLPPSGVRYTRHVTQAWCVFFVLNGSISLWTAQFGSWHIWTLYNGLISYVLMGTMFCGEWLIRRRVPGSFAVNDIFSPLQQLHRVQRDPDLRVAQFAGRTIEWRQFVADVRAQHQRVQQIPAQNWGLYCEESYPFAVALLGLLGAGKTIYLPANNTEGTFAQIKFHCELLIGDWSNAETIPRFTEYAQSKTVEHLPALHGQIVIFTSGSTAAPQAITKNLRQLDAELHTHEQLWGQLFAGADILATVSHQHIYGLLFKVLGPLCAGRCFHSAIYRDPANLIDDAAVLKKAVWIASPPHLQRLQREWPWSTHRLAAIFSSGGPLTATAATLCSELSGHWPIEVYGSSETGGIATRTQEFANRLWSSFPDVRVDTDADSCLKIQSPHLENPDWFTSADTATLHADRFELRARADRMVKIEGKRLSLPELEMRLEEHVFITRCRALLVERERQRVGIVAELTADGKRQLAELGNYVFTRALRTHLQHHFEPVVLPRLWRFPETLPTDTQGKTRLDQLQSLFAEPAIASIPLSEKPMPITLPEIINVKTIDASCTLQLHISPELAYFSGHFPTTPVVPGVALLRWAENFARRYLAITGTNRALEVIKFKKLVRPGDELTLTLNYRTETGKLNFSFSSPTGEHSSGRMLFEAECVGGEPCQTP